MVLYGLPLDLCGKHIVVLYGLPLDLCGKHIVVLYGLPLDLCRKHIVVLYGLPVDLCRKHIVALFGQTRCNSMSFAQCEAHTSFCNILVQTWSLQYRSGSIRVGK